ncbi:MAG: hypothetical protein KIT82_00330 [Bradyrhizobium sp.]|nr:hypothetical protein [Bradyrhizobium sp.]
MFDLDVGWIIVAKNENRVVSRWMAAISDPVAALDAVRILCTENEVLEIECVTSRAALDISRVRKGTVELLRPEEGR